MLTTLLMAAALTVQSTPAEGRQLLAAMEECKAAMSRPIISRIEIRDDCTRALNIALSSDWATEETAPLLAKIVWDARPGGLYGSIEADQGVK